MAAFQNDPFAPPAQQPAHTGLDPFAPVQQQQFQQPVQQFQQPQQPVQNMDPFAPTPAPAPAAFGSYTVKTGDTCYSIADAQCQDGNDYATEICNAASVCTNLQVGASIKYDCSKTGAHC